MNCTVLLLALTLSANAQSPMADEPSAQGETTVTKKVDPKLHADAIRLVEVSGVKQRLEDNLEMVVDGAQKVMMDQCQRCTPEFGKEWKKP